MRYVCNTRTENSIWAGSYFGTKKAYAIGDTDSITSYKTFFSVYSAAFVWSIVQITVFFRDTYLRLISRGNSDHILSSIKHARNIDSTKLMSGKDKKKS